MAEEKYISNKETLTRIVQLETELRVRREEQEKALIIAREYADKEKANLKCLLAAEKLVTDHKMSTIERLVYSGLGAVLLLELIVRFVIK